MSKETKPVIFLAFANDREGKTGYLRNLPEEARQLYAVLDAAAQAGLCEVVMQQNVTVDSVLDTFQDARYRDRIAIFHYGGHAESYELLLETADGKRAAADAGGLAAFLSRQRGLQLVFLNGCSTQPQVQGLLDSAAGAGAARRRHRRGHRHRPGHRRHRGYRLCRALLQGACRRRCAADCIS